MSKIPEEYDAAIQEIVHQFKQKHINEPLEPFLIKMLQAQIQRKMQDMKMKGYTCSFSYKDNGDITVTLVPPKVETFCLADLENGVKEMMDVSGGWDSRAQEEVLAYARHVYWEKMYIDCRINVEEYSNMVHFIMLYADTIRRK